jgi:hypothetical protein
MPGDEYFEAINDEVTVLLMMEEADAVENHRGHHRSLRHYGAIDSPVYTPYMGGWLLLSRERSLSWVRSWLQGC